jgi:NADH-quinone oxidoreductase subunit N
MPNLNDILTLLPEAYLTGAICVLLLLDAFISERQRAAVHWLTLLVLGVTALLVISGQMQGTASAFGGMYLRDPLAEILKLAAIVVTAIVFLLARPYIEDRRIAFGEFHTLTLFALLGVMLLVSAGSLIMVYLGLELLTLSSYALVALNRDSPLSSEAAIKYFVLGALSSGLLLYGMSMIYGATGTLDLNAIRMMVPMTPHHDLLVFGLVFLIVGIAFKFGAAPFHMWLPDVYEGSPTAVTVFIGSAPKLAAVGMALRLLDMGLPELLRDWQPMLAVLAVLSLAIGSLLAIVQTSLKRMLAYSTIAHMGYLFLGLSAGTAFGNAVAVFYAIAYALMATAAFGIILALSRAGFEADQIDDLRGLNQRSPWFAGLMAITMFSLAGVPPLFGFFAKLLVLQAAINAGMLWLALVGAVFAIIGLYYYLRVVKVMYFDKPSADHALAASSNLPLRWVLSVNALALLVLGVLWGPLFDWCLRAFAAG